MARIIKIKPDLEKKIVHKECGAEIGYYENELEKEWHEYYDGSSDYRYWLKCPHCHKDIRVK